MFAGNVDGGASLQLPATATTEVWIDAVGSGGSLDKSGLGNSAVQGQHQKP